MTSSVDGDTSYLELMPSALKVLKEMREEGHKLAICSNTNLRLRTLSFIKNSGLQDIVHHVTLSCDIGARKPNPEVLSEIFAVFPEFSKEQILFVGDMMNRDILCA